MIKNFTEENESIQRETLDSFICKDIECKISHKAFFTAFKHRSKVEFLKFFIV